ncbi:MAG: FAD-dependent oxidoreductase [Bacillota bacterium]
MKYKCSVCHHVFPYLPEICPVCGADKQAFKEYEEEKITFRNDTNEKFVIIGGGIAALETAKSIRARNKTAEIKLVFSEDKLPYNRPALSDVICGGMNFADIVLENYNYYKNNNIQLYKKTLAKAIDTNKKTVTLSDNTTLKYDKLCLACGASSFCPFDIEKSLLPIKTLRDYNDALDIINLAKKGKKVIIAGGGILGIEAAHSLNVRGMDVTVVERGASIVKAQLDKKSSKMLKSAFEDKGVKVLLNTNVKEIKKDKVVTDHGEVVADFMIVSMGVRGYTQLAKDARLDVDKAIKVDDFMKTSDDFIYSAGDCAEYRGKPGGLWIISSAQGKCAGANMAGDKVKYQLVPFGTAFTGADVTFFAAGDVHSDDNKTLESGDSYKLLSFKDNKLIGGLLWGDTSKSNELMDLMADTTKKDTAIKKLL